jgi:hypothetical protein
MQQSVAALPQAEFPTVAVEQTPYVPEMPPPVAAQPEQIAQPAPQFEPEPRVEFEPAPEPYQGSAPVQPEASQQLFQGYDSQPATVLEPIEGHAAQSEPAETAPGAFAQQDVFAVESSDPAQQWPAEVQIQVAPQERPYGDEPPALQSGVEASAAYEPAHALYSEPVAQLEPADEVPSPVLSGEAPPDVFQIQEPQPVMSPEAALPAAPAEHTTIEPQVFQPPVEEQPQEISCHQVEQPQPEADVLWVEPAPVQTADPESEMPQPEPFAPVDSIAQPYDPSPEPFPLPEQAAEPVAVLPEQDVVAFSETIAPAPEPETSPAIFDLEITEPPADGLPAPETALPESQVDQLPESVSAASGSDAEKLLQEQIEPLAEEPAAPASGFESITVIQAPDDDPAEPVTQSGPDASPDAEAPEVTVPVTPHVAARTRGDEILDNINAGRGIGKDELFESALDEFKENSQSVEDLLAQVFGESEEEQPAEEASSDDDEPATDEAIDQSDVVTPSESASKKRKARASSDFVLEKADPKAGDTARTLLDIMSKPSSAAQPQERALAADTLLRLVPRIPVHVLIALGERICMMEKPPSLLVEKMLRHPDPEVAGPLLEGCAGIDDQVLMNVIFSGDPDKLRMIARRRSLTPSMCDELLEQGEAAVYLTLVRNPGAPLSHDAFVQLSEFAKDLPALQAPLVTRGDTPPPIAFELFWNLPSELRRYVLSRFLTDSETLDKILKITLAVDGSKGTAPDDPATPELEEMNRFVEHIEKGKTRAGTELLSSLASINHENAARIIGDVEGEPLAVAMKAIGYPRTEFSGVVDRWRKPEGVLANSQRTTEELQNLFDSLSYNKARMLLTYWDWASDKSGPYARKAA